MKNEPTQFLPLQRMKKPSPYRWLVWSVIFELIGLAAFITLLVLIYVQFA
jgi:hypothetical protein